MWEHHLQRACWQFQILDAAEVIGHPAINRLGPCFLSFPSFLGGEYRLNYLTKVPSFFWKNRSFFLSVLGGEYTI